MSTTDFFSMAQGIAKVVSKVATPLTDEQFIALSGALGVCVEKAMHDARQAAIDEAAAVCNRVGRRQGTLSRGFAVQDCFEAVVALKNQ